MSLDQLKFPVGLVRITNLNLVCTLDPQSPDGPPRGFTITVTKLPFHSFTMVGPFSMSVNRPITEIDRNRDHQRFVKYLPSRRAMLCAMSAIDWLTWLVPYLLYPSLLLGRFRGKGGYRGQSCPRPWSDHTRCISSSWHSILTITIDIGGCTTAG
jgi:hypothetical protein